MRNTAGKKRVRQEDVASDYPFHSFLAVPAFCRPEILGFFAIRPPRCQTVLTSW
jgi:hypothetical protein